MEGLVKLQVAQNQGTFVGTSTEASRNQVVRSVSLSGESMSQILLEKGLDMQRMCLTMVVKDESQFIRTAIDSWKLWMLQHRYSFVPCWAVLDRIDGHARKTS